MPRLTLSKPKKKSIQEFADDMKKVDNMFGAVSTLLPMCLELRDTVYHNGVEEFGEDAVMQHPEIFAALTAIENKIGDCRELIEKL